MGGELAAVEANRAAVPAAGPVDVLSAFLSGRNPRTLRAYDRDLNDFARFLGAPDSRAAVAGLLDLPHGHANAAALGYKASPWEASLCTRLTSF